MADQSKPQSLMWPAASWKSLKKIVRAWYTAESSGDVVTQRDIAKVGGLQASRVSANKPFLQAIGIIEPEGIALTEGGRQLGLGLTTENARIIQQALQTIVQTNALLKHLWNAVRGRGTTDAADFEAHVVLLTKLGPDSDYFSTGVNVLRDVLLESELVGMAENNGLRPNIRELKEEPQDSLQGGTKPVTSDAAGLRQIPIAVSPSKVWFIQIDENPDEAEIVKFIEMQKLIFSLK
jgi:hypothetical protein